MSVLENLKSHRDVPQSCLDVLDVTLLQQSWNQVLSLNNLQSI